MTVHVKKNPKDYASTRGLIAMVSARKKLLSYLRAQNKDRFLKLCVNLKIRIQKKPTLIFLLLTGFLSRV